MNTNTFMHSKKFIYIWVISTGNPIWDISAISFSPLPLGRAFKYYSSLKQWLITMVTTRTRRIWKTQLIARTDAINYELIQNQKAPFPPMLVRLKLPQRPPTEQPAPAEKENMSRIFSGTGRQSEACYSLMGLPVSCSRPTAATLTGSTF